jgi:drug/metabolite transporter (DMT)-like permease
LTSIWKRTAIGFIFALGFGLALAGHMQEPHQGQWLKAPYWGLIYLGFMLPTLIYLLKWVLTFKAQQLGIVAPEYLKLHHWYTSLPFYMPKTVYVAFCLPLFAISLGRISLQIHEQRWRPWTLILNLSACAAVLFVFYAENIKNGVAYALMLTIIFCAALLLKYRSRIRAREVIFIFVLVASISFFTLEHLKKNDSWSSLFADLRVAVQLDRHEQWKFPEERGLPNNELGKTVSGTNYLRIAWGIVGMELLFKNPLGYGLIERSFGHLAKEQWPESKLNQNHSGWLDLALGLGLPGMALILGALAIALRRCIHSPSPIAYFGYWLLLSLLLLWCTTEVSQRVYFDWLIFAIVWVSALSMSSIGPNAATLDKI